MNDTAKLREADRQALKKIGAVRVDRQGDSEYYTLPAHREDDFYRIRDSLNFRVLYAAPFPRVGGLQLRFDLPNIEGLYSRMADDVQRRIDECQKSADDWNRRAEYASDAEVWASCIQQRDDMLDGIERLQRERDLYRETAKNA